MGETSPCLLKGYWEGRDGRSMVGLLEVAATLTKAYPEVGDKWWPIDQAHHEEHGTDPRFEIMVGAILVQNTSWTNVATAMAGLKSRRLLDPKRMARAEPKVLREAIRSAGHFNLKADYLHTLAGRVAYKWKGDLDAFLSQPVKALRQELLGLKGIGPETADAILVYAARRPSFVIDDYTRRLMMRLGLATGKETYAQLQSQWAAALPPEADRFGRIHALIVEHAKLRCTAKRPRCPQCPLESVCRKVDVEPEVYLRSDGS
jgi:endonuclease III related protein